MKTFNEIELDDLLKHGTRQQIAEVIPFTLKLINELYELNLSIFNDRAEIDRLKKHIENLQELVQLRQLQENNMLRTYLGQILLMVKNKPINFVEWERNVLQDAGKLV